MKETGLMFKAPLVRTILAGQKTQTRRPVALPRKRDSFVMLNHGKGFWPYQSDDGESALCDDGNEHPYSSPYGMPGDRIYVRETFGHFERNENFVPGCTCFYRADGDCVDLQPWRPSMHMPKHAARIWLEVTGVRVERLQSISEADAVRDGGLHRLPATGRYVINQGDQYFGMATHDPRELFREIWESTGGDWAANPWVWVIDFKTISTTGRPA